MANKADETFQESVQALANWIAFLERKLTYYTRQLERASAQQPSQDASVEEVPAAPVEEGVKEAPDVGNAGTWVQVETGAADREDTSTKDDALGGWDFEEDDELDSWDIEEDPSDGEQGDHTAVGSEGELDSWDTEGGNGRAKEAADAVMDTWNDDKVGSWADDGSAEEEEGK